MYQADYRGEISETQAGDDCMRWDNEDVSLYPRAGLEENNYCRNPIPVLHDRAWCRGLSTDDECDVPMCDPQFCAPSCGAPNLEQSGCPSFLQAENCCEDGDASCRCTYLKEACLKSLENGSTDFCEDAEAACFDSGPDNDAKCVLYEQFCVESSSDAICDAAAQNCCSLDDPWISFCFCDFHTFTVNELDLGSESKAEQCLEASKVITWASMLQDFFYDTGGYYWFNNTGWLEDSPMCERFGVICNEVGEITEINLKANNLTGSTDLINVAVLELKKLNLADNKLSGTIPGKATLLLRSLVSIDISNNQFSGQADMLFGPATLNINYSNNKFTSVRFKRFNAAFEMIREIDLSYNLIDQDASQVLRNIPTNIETLKLSNNFIKGPFPNPFPSLGRLKLFSIANNNINGPVPDFSRTTPRLRELDLSNQRSTGSGGLTGIIPPDTSKLEDMLVMNLAFNNLTGIPSDLGSLEKLQVLNVSANAISQEIPPELAKLAGEYHCLDRFR